MSFSTIKSHPYFLQYVLYSFGFVLLGNLLVALGPFIPYLSEAQHKIETQYSIFFITRAIGFISGAFAVKYIEKYTSYHQGLGLGFIISGFFSVMFNLASDIYFRSLWISCAAFGYSLINVFANISTINAFKKTNLDNWLQFLHGCFGIGGLIGPLMIYIFQFQAYTILGVLIFLLGPVIMKIKSPEIQESELPLLKSEEKNQTKGISKYCLILLCFSFLMIVGQQITFGSWIPSYSVLKEYSTKQHATLYSSLFWISITFFRFAFVFIPGKPSQKIPILLSTGFIGSFIVLFVITKVNSQIGLILSSLVYGFATSALFPLLLSIADQFGQIILPTQNSYFILFGAFGEGFISVLTGQLMQYLSYQMLFVILALLNFLALINHYKICSLFKITHSEKQSQMLELDKP